MTETVPETVESLLTSEPLIAHLATSLNDRPHVAPVWYYYENEIVEIVTGGRKLANIRQNPRVALSIQKDDDGHTEWMVSLLGTARVIEDDEAFRAANHRINETYDVDEDAYETNTLVRVSVGTVNCTTY